MKENFKCNDIKCDKEFATRAYLNQHKRIHSCDKPYVCHFNDCQHTSRSKWDLIKHEKRIHLNIKSFKCDYNECGKCFFTKRELTLHTNNRHLK